MITDPVLIRRAQLALTSKPRRYVQLPDLLAVCQKESGGVPIFTGDEPLYRQNLRAAERITGLGEAAILEAVRIRNGELAGKVAKFRCEPGYWEWAKKLPGDLPSSLRFNLSCSFGVGQKMMRWLVANTPRDGWGALVERFKGDVPMQLLYAAGDLDALMVQQRGNKPAAFTAYNAGTKYKDRKVLPVVSNYGEVVEGFSALYQK